MQEKQTDSLKNLQSGLRTAFENSKLRSDENYRPQFVFNNYQEGRKVLASLDGCYLYFSKQNAWFLL